MALPDWIIVALAAVLLIGTLAPFWRRKEWWVRDWEFPRLQLVALCGAVATAGLWRLDAGRPLVWLAVAVALGCLAWQAAWIVPFTPLYPVQVRRASRRDGDRLRLLVSNVYMENRETQRLLDLVLAEQPDLLLALEPDDLWAEQLAPLKDTMPYRMERPQPDTFGMVLYSRLPLEDATVQHLVEDHVPSFHATVVTRGGSRIRLYCVHPGPPSPTEYDDSAERDAELIQIGQLAVECGLPVIVAGDLNDVAWSRTTRRFLRISGLRDPRVGRGLYNTFHAKVPLMRWPLDHIFHSGPFELVRLERGPAVGSDHFPMLIELALPPGRGGDPQRELSRS